MNSGGFVKTEGLSKVYSSGKINVVALDDVTLAVEEGKFLGVTGPSGSGKSTLMNLLGGLDRPSSGNIKVEGKFISELDKEELALGWVVSMVINQIANHFLIKQGAPYTNYFSFPWWLCTGAIAFSIIISLAAGLYPAVRAARIDPVVALRHD